MLNSGFKELPEKHITIITDMVSDYAGLSIDRLFLRQVSRKISQQMSKYTISDPDEYISMLWQDGKYTFVMEDLLAVLTVSESYFFRNSSQFEYLYYEYFPDFFFNNKDIRPMRVWSAGCSRGEEPYSVSILLNKCKEKNPLVDYIIKAGDINTANLQTAVRKTYSPRSVRTSFNGFEKKMLSVPGKYDDSGSFILDKKYTENVTFEKLNLNLENDLIKLRWSDIIMCRNVLIYFKEDLKSRLVDTFYDCLNPGGILLLGETESLPGNRSDFITINYKNTFIYKKVA